MGRTSAIIISSRKLYIDRGMHDVVYPMNEMPEKRLGISCTSTADPLQEFVKTSAEAVGVAVMQRHVEIELTQKLLMRTPTHPTY